MDSRVAFYDRLAESLFALLFFKPILFAVVVFSQSRKKYRMEKTLLENGKKRQAAEKHLTRK